MRLHSCTPSPSSRKVESRIGFLAYLASLHPEKQLLPGDARGRADVERWVSQPNLGR